MRFTDFQRDVLRLTGEGMSPKEIEDALGRSLAAVYTMRHKLAKQGYLVKTQAGYETTEEGEKVLLADDASNGYDPTVLMQRNLNDVEQAIEAIEHELERRHTEIKDLDGKLTSLRALREQLTTLVEA